MGRISNLEPQLEKPYFFRKRQFNSTHPALMGFSAILKNNPQKSKNN
jgi:hypothetical protein